MYQEEKIHSQGVPGGEDPFTGCTRRRKSIHRVYQEEKSVHRVYQEEKIHSQGVPGGENPFTGCTMRRISVHRVCQERKTHSQGIPGEKNPFTRQEGIISIHTVYQEGKSLHMVYQKLKIYL
jgi:hypothetical protein